MMSPLDQKRFEALFAVGFEFQKQGQLPKAVGAYQEATKINPRHASVHNNLGNCYRSLGLFEASILEYEKALAIEPGKNSASLNQALALLALNRYEEAWPLYEYRLPAIPFRSEVLTSGKLKWDGTPLDEETTLFLYSNQGIGDELQMSRYLPMVAERCSNIVLEVHHANFGLFKNCPWVSEVRTRPASGKYLPDYDYHCELFSLPGIFNTSFESVPPSCEFTYQRDQSVAEVIAHQKNEFPSHRHIGLVWSGNPKNDLNPYRACGLVHLLPLLQLNHCRFYSLQKGLPANDIKTFDEKLNGNLFDLSANLTTMASTATAIEALDLVITTDTSIPHLAATLGEEVWVLLHQPSDWRWTVDRAESPWYPNARLFRQPTKGVWTTLIDQVAVALK